VDKSEEEKLRELIRKELDNRDKLLGSKHEERRIRIESGGMTPDQQRIIEDEIRTFYKQKGDYRPYTNEDGDVEWLSEDEIHEREMQIPVDIEELEEGQKKIRNRYILLVVLFFCALGLLAFSLRDKTGTIQVISNIPDCTIILDGVQTEFRTDYTLKKMSAGAHLISVTKFGYVVEGELNRRVKVQTGGNEIIVFNLKPRSESGNGR
jgi:hypothetical protein